MGNGDPFEIRTDVGQGCTRSFPYDRLDHGRHLPALEGKGWALRPQQHKSQP